MSTSNGPNDQYGAYEREFNIEMLRTQVFGAFYAVVEYRRNTIRLTNMEIARRSDWSRSMITKTLGAPSNWTLKTISELATALDVDFKFYLVDRTDRSRNFDANGLLLDFSQIPQGMVMGQSQAAFGIDGITRPSQRIEGNVTFVQTNSRNLFPISSPGDVGLQVDQP